MSNETIPKRGQRTCTCVLKEDHLAILYASGETPLNQAFSLPLFWNDLSSNHEDEQAQQPDEQEERK